MTMTDNFVEQRTVLRLRLQAQRQVFCHQLASIDLDHNEFPRSMTMRLLTHRSSLSLVIVTEIFPKLISFVLNRSGFKF